jgi:hypothetical protein
VGKSSHSKRPKKPAPPPQRQDRDAVPEVEFLPPLKPHRKLLIVLSAAFALWLALLLVLRFTTVAGHGEEQHPHDEPAQRQPMEGTVPRPP